MTGRSGKQPFTPTSLDDKKDDRGVYRRIPVRILGALRESVQPYLIQPKMEELLENYRHGKEPIVLRVAKFHVDFEGIHPFIDSYFADGVLAAGVTILQGHRLGSVM